MCIFLDELPIIICEPKKASHFSHISGHWPLMDGFHLFGISVYTIFRYNMAQIDEFLPEKIHHFEGLSFNPTCLSSSNMAVSLNKCSSGVLEKTITSSRHMIQYHKCKFLKQLCINHCKVAGAFVNPKGMH